MNSLRRRMLVEFAINCLDKSRFFTLILLVVCSAILAYGEVSKSSAVTEEKKRMSEVAVKLKEWHEAEQMRQYLRVYTNGMEEAEAQRAVDLYVRERRAREKLLHMVISKEPHDSTAALIAEFKQLERMRQSGDRRTGNADCLRRDPSGWIDRAKEQSECSFDRFSAADGDTTSASELNAMRDLRRRDPDRFGYYMNSKCRAKPCVFCGKADLEVPNRLFFSLSKQVMERSDEESFSKGAKLRHRVGFFAPCCAECLDRKDSINAVARLCRWGACLLIGVVGWGVVLLSSNRKITVKKITVLVIGAIVFAFLKGMENGLTGFAYGKLCGLREISMLVSRGYELDSGGLVDDLNPRRLQMPLDMGEMTGGTWKSEKQRHRAFGVRKECLYEWMGDATE